MTKEKFKILAAIYLKGDALDPSRVSDLLGVSPSRSRHKGQKSHTSTDLEVTAKTGLWALEIEKDADSIDLPIAIGELIRKVGTRVSDLKTIPGLEDAYVDVFIATDADGDGEGTCTFELSEQNLAALKSIGLPIHFTVAVVKP
jgi:hypothetical protein